MQNPTRTVPASVRHTVRRDPGSAVVIEAEVAADRLARAAEEIDRTIAAMRDSHAQLRPVDRAAQAGDIVTVDIDATIPDRALPPFARNAHIEAGKPIGIEGLGEALVGVKGGETKTVELAFPDDASEGALRGKKATFSLRPSGINEKILPALDDEFAKTV